MQQNSQTPTIYSRSMITRNISLPISVLGRDMESTLSRHIKHLYEGKCIIEGYVRPESIQLITFSSGLIERGNFVRVEIIFECDICFPVEGMEISCLVKSVVKAGIRAESATDVPSPIVVFISKDHHYKHSAFASIRVGDIIIARVIGHRFELNDANISIVAELPLSRNTQRDKRRTMGGSSSDSITISSTTI